MKTYLVAISTFIKGDFRNAGEEVKLSEEEAAGYVKQGLVTEPNAEGDDESGEAAAKKPAAKKSK